jgi:hypothetical protein
VQQTVANKSNGNHMGEYVGGEYGGLSVKSQAAILEAD